MDRCSFLGKYLAGFLVLGVWLMAVVVAADPADHVKPSGAEAADEDFDVLMRRSNPSGPTGKDGNKGSDPGAPREAGQDDESYRRFLINALMGLKQQQWGWMGASSGPQGQQPVVYTAPPPTSQEGPHQPAVTSQPQQQPPPPPPQQPPPVAAQPPSHPLPHPHPRPHPPPPPPQQTPQQPIPPMCQQYPVMPQAAPPPMQSFAEKLHPQFGQCVTVLLPSPAAIPAYNTMVQNPLPGDTNVSPMQANVPGCRGGCNGRPHPPRRPYY